MENIATNDPLLTRGQVADRLGISPSTLEKWATKGRGPEYLYFGHKMVRYPQSALNRWIASQPVKGNAT